MNDELNEIPGATPDFRTELAEKLAELVPEAVADGKIDTKKLEELLDGDAADTRERFGLFWPGKKRALRAAQEPTTATLVPDKEDSKDWDTTQNVFIEGDNLEVLKILQKHYHGKIKMIYIDPPYNTGKDFVYPDNYQEGLKSYLEFTKQVDEGGKKLSTNSDQAGRYHSNWLNMMYPRLKLARNLLARDGAMFISIDDTEASSLVALCREFFGEQNVLGMLIHQRAKGGGQARYVVRGHDYLVAIGRDVRHLLPLLRPKVVQKPIVTIDGVDYIKDDDVVRRSFGKYDKVQDRRCFYEELEELKGVAKKKEIDQRISDGTMLLEFNETVGMHVIVELTPVSEAASKVYSIIRVLSEEGKNDLDSLGLGDIFDYPKPVDFVKQVVESVALRDKKATVLDFFAGSGTTGHAVMKLNAEDGGNRRCIQVQLPEPVPTDSPAHVSGYVTISEVSRERLRRAGGRLMDDYREEISARPSVPDFGFRTYKLSETNFAKWRLTSDVAETELEQHLLGLRESADDQASQEALLTELLLKRGYSLTEQVDVFDVAGLEIHGVKDAEGDYGLLAYLNEHHKPSLEQLRALVDAAEAQIVILEDAFLGDDELKTNLAQLCKSKGIELWTA